MPLNAVRTPSISSVLSVGRSSIFINTAPGKFGMSNAGVPEKTWAIADRRGMPPVAQPRRGGRIECGSHFGQLGTVCRYGSSGHCQQQRKTAPMVNDLYQDVVMACFCLSLADSADS